MNISERKFSALISPYDVRDYKIACVSETVFPDSFSLEEVSVKDQGSTGSCVAHACSSIIEYHNKRQEGTDTVFSTEFIYGYRPAGYYIGEGMYLRDALKTIQKLGDCPLNDLKGNHEYAMAISTVKKKLEELKPLAEPHRISTYMKVDKVEEIKQALMKYGYVLASMPWHSDYSLKDGVYTFTSSKTRGNHAVVIYGWNENGWLVHNSWGKSWGKKGKFIVPFDFKWNETWAITDNIVNGEDIIKPEDNKFIKIFSKIINTIVNFFKNIFKKN